MFERFTDRARRVLVLAQEEARLLNHNFLGTEHILLGLVHEGEGVAAKALEAVGVKLADVRTAVETIVPPGSAGQTHGAPPFTPRAKKVLEMSLREALQLGHNYIGTEHLLLGLVREGDGVAAQVLVAKGADLSKVRAKVVELLSGYGGAQELAGSGQAFGEQTGYSVGARRLGMIARNVASQMDDKRVGTQHYLVALLQDETSLAAKVLESLGVTRDAVSTRIAEIGVAGSSDDPFEGRMEVEIASGTKVVIEDPDLAARIRRGEVEIQLHPVESKEPADKPDAPDEPETPEAEAT